MAILAIACCGSRKRKCTSEWRKAYCPIQSRQLFCDGRSFRVSHSALSFLTRLTSLSVITWLMMSKQSLSWTTSLRWKTMLTNLDAHPIKVEDVWLFRVARRPPTDVETTWRELRRRFDTERIVTLVAGAEKYLSGGGSLDSLSVLKAEKLNLIPKDSLVGPPTLVIPGLPIESKRNIDPHLLDGVWLGKTPDGLVSVGAQVWYSAAAPMVEQLRRVASGIYYPYPDKLTASVLGTEQPSGWLLMTFTREQLARAGHC